MTQHAILRCRPGASPQWSFRSLPRVTGGGGNTLDGAIRAYHQSSSSAGRPSPVLVHTEREVAPHLWVRQAQDEHAARRHRVSDQLQRLAPAHSQEIVHLLTHRAADGDALVVVALPAETLDDVAAQLTDRDSAWVLCPLSADDDVAIAWTPLIGRASACREGRDLATFADWGLSGRSSIEAFFRTIAARSARDSSAGVLLP